MHLFSQNYPTPTSPRRSFSGLDPTTAHTHVSSVMGGLQAAQGDKGRHMGTQPQSTCPRTPWKPGPLAKPPAPLSYWGQGGQGKPVSPPRGLLCSWNKTEPCGTRVSQGGLHRDNMNPNSYEAGTRGGTRFSPRGLCREGPVCGRVWVQPVIHTLHGGPQPGRHTAAALCRLPQQPALGVPQHSTASPPPLLPQASTQRAPQLGLPARVCLPPSRHKSTHIRGSAWHVLSPVTVRLSFR